MSAQGEYFEGQRLDIHPGQYGIEIVFGAEKTSSGEEESE